MIAALGNIVRPVHAGRYPTFRLNFLNATPAHIEEGIRGLGDVLSRRA
jgi:DNA-binding transcriptional MocR family regulator